MATGNGDGLYFYLLLLLYAANKLYCSCKDYNMRDISCHWMTLTVSGE